MKIKNVHILANRDFVMDYRDLQTFQYGIKFMLALRRLDTDKAFDICSELVLDAAPASIAGVLHQYVDSLVMQIPNIWRNEVDWLEYFVRIHDLEGPFLRYEYVTRRIVIASAESDVRRGFTYIAKFMTCFLEPNLLMLANVLACDRQRIKNIVALQDLADECLYGRVWENSCRIFANVWRGLISSMCGVTATVFQPEDLF